jgi:hypothetical protein
MVTTSGTGIDPFASGGSLGTVLVDARPVKLYYAPKGWSFYLKFYGIETGLPECTQMSLEM